MAMNATKRRKAAGTQISKKKIAIPFQEASPSPTPHPPVENLYTDRITTFEAFVGFLERILLPTTRLWKKMARDILSDTPWNISGCKHPVSSFTKEQQEYIEKFYKFLNANTIGCPEPITEQNWRYMREAMRFLSHEIFITAVGRQKIEESLLVPDETGHWKVRFRREIPPYIPQLVGLHGILLNPNHFIHISSRDPAYICYVDEQCLIKDITIETTISKYIKKYFPEISNDALRNISDMHKLNCLGDGVIYYSSLDDILHGYRHGPSSCMSKTEEEYMGHMHPLAAYADRPGISLAVLPSLDGGKTYQSRSFVFEHPLTHKKQYIRVYGSTLLGSKLIKKGFIANGTWSGATINKIPALDKNKQPLPQTYIAPYLDDLNARTTGNNPARYGYTNSTLDHFVCGTNEECQNMMKRKMPGEEIIDLSSATGLAGMWAQYSRHRHNYWRCQIQGKPYTDPVTGKFNQMGETICAACAEIYEKPYIIPVVSGATYHYWCKKCVNSVSRRRDHLLPVEEKLHEDMQVYASVTVLFALPRVKTEKKYPVLMGDDIISAGFTDKTHAFFLLKDAESKGYVQMNPDWYSSKNIEEKTNPKIVNIEGTWAYKDDICTTVSGDKIHKNHAYFLGQNFAGELQFFSMSSILIRSALTKGNLYMAGDKLAYDKNKSFKPIERRNLFSTLMEIEEDEDEINGVPSTLDQDLAVLECVPLIDVLNVLWTMTYIEVVPVSRHRVPKNHDIEITINTVYERLMDLLPRVTPSFLIAIISLYRDLIDDPYAGIDGISSLRSHMLHAFNQASMKPAEAYLYGPSGKNTPPPPGSSTLEGYINSTTQSATNTNTSYCFSLPADSSRSAVP